MPTYEDKDNAILQVLKQKGELRTIAIQKELLELFNYIYIPKSTLWDHLVKLANKKKVSRRIVRPDLKMGITYWSVVE